MASNNRPEHVQDSYARSHQGRKPPTNALEAINVHKVDVTLLTHLSKVSILPLFIYFKSLNNLSKLIVKINVYIYTLIAAFYKP